MTEKKRAKINNWFETKVCGMHGLFGDIDNHPKIGNCKGVFTSEVLKIDRENRTCETTNTIYELGTELKHE